MTNNTFDLIDSVLASTADFGVAGCTIDAQTLTIPDGSSLAWTVSDAGWTMTAFTATGDVTDRDADTSLASLADRVLARARQLTAS